MNYRIEYVLASIFLLVVLFLSCHLFLFDDFVRESEAKITGMLVSLVLGFGIFQFWINEVNIDRRRLYDFRHDAYKEFVRQIDDISEILNYEMTGKEVQNLHLLLSRLMNNINRLNSAITMHGDFLFPGLHLSPEAKNMVRITEKILKRTEEFRLHCESAVKEENEIARNFRLSTSRMQWHNEIGEYLKVFHNSKYPFYSLLNSYL
jgi:hypothetical protein